MDKFKNNSDLTPALIVKLILVLVFLLTAAFVSGVVIGKNGRRNIDRTSSDEEGINEKLSNCIFNSDELRGKYLKLRDAAREKGLVDENDVINMKIVCSVTEQKPVAKQTGEKSAETFSETSSKEPKPEEKPSEPESVETSPETSQKEPSEPEKAKPAEQKPAEKSVETLPETSQKEPAKPEKKEKSDKNRTIDEILAEKSDAPKKEAAKCRFSIQIFAANTKEQAVAAGKKYKSIKTRVVGGEDKGKTWYKLRTGCFDSREAAEEALPKVRNSAKDAYIVSE